MQGVGQVPPDIHAESVRRAQERRVEQGLVGRAEVEGRVCVGLHGFAVALAAFGAHGGRIGGMMDGGTGGRVVEEEF